MTKAYAAKDRKGFLEPVTIERRKVQPDDVKVIIEYCGVCHSDIHFVRGDWGDVPWPVVPGHEILGKVVEVGKNVTEFTIGQKVGVGVLVDNCGKSSCFACSSKEENYCPKRTGTYGAPDRRGEGFTNGGYSQSIVTQKDWVFPVADNIYGPHAAPLLCAGITTYAPLLRANVKAGQKVGVVGLGGLGHLGIKFAKAMGAHVVMITTSKEKGLDAKKLGADEVLLSKEKGDLKKHAYSFDFILNTVPVKHDLNPYLRLLRLGGSLSIVGALEPISMNAAYVANNRLNVTGSTIGSISETRQMLKFCADHEIVADIEVVKIQDINKANTRVINGDIKYRFVIDIASLSASGNL